MKTIKKVLVVFKSFGVKVPPIKGSEARQWRKRITLARRERAHALRIVKQTLRRQPLFFRVVSRVNLGSVRGYDLIISLGGDGTLLRVSHHVGDELVVAVNASPSTSVGALCPLKPRAFPAFFKKLRIGEIRLKKLNRMAVFVNGKRRLSGVLNDVLFANNFPGGTSRYLIRIGKKLEDQKSSGVWVATAAGSTAGILAAGGRAMPLLSKKLQFLVREPFGGKHSSCRLVRGFVQPGRGIRLINKMPRASLFIDGLQAVSPLRYGDQIELRSALVPLNLVVSRN